VHLVQCTFSGLDDADAVLGVTGGDLEATDLAAQTLADGEARGIVTGAVDPET
jgi:hypothetical protein